MAKKSKSKTSSKGSRINGAKKGKQWERDVSNAIGHIFPAAERMLEYQASGNVGVDIQGTGIFKIQCKRNAGYAPISRIHEVRTNDKADIPVLATKGNRMEAMAVLPFDKFVYLLEICHGLQPLLRKPEDDASKEIFTGEAEGVVAKTESTRQKVMGYPVFINESVAQGWLIEAETAAGSKHYSHVPPLYAEEWKKFVKEEISNLVSKSYIPKALHVGSMEKMKETFANAIDSDYTIRTTKNEAKDINLNNLI